MSEKSFSVDEIRSMRYERQLDVICDRFEDAWKRGESPDVRTLSSLASPEYQSRVMRELIVIENECEEHHGATRANGSTSPTNSVQSIDGSTLSSPSNSNQMGQLPTHFDKFLIRRLIGKGAHGSVYEAEDVSTRRRVALKIAERPTLSVGRGAAFQTEAANTVRISHPSIVQIWEVGEKNGIAYIASEMVNGRDLKTLLSEFSLSPSSVIAIVADVVAGLHAAHSAGVIHRDLKPSNILVEDIAHDLSSEIYPQFEYDPLRRRVRIIDFGVSKYLDQTIDYTQIGDLVGTPHYMSPEQARGDSRQVDERSDIFSVGVILFEMLTGQLPFPGEPLVAIAAIRDTKAKSIRDVKPELSPVLANIVATCLERNPANRFSSAKGLEAVLREWLARGTVALIKKQQIQKRLIRTAVAAGAIALCSITAVYAIAAWITKEGESIASVGELRTTESVFAPVHKLQRWVDEASLDDLVSWFEVRNGVAAEMRTDLEQLNAILNPNENWHYVLAQHLIDQSQIDEAESLEIAKTIYNCVDSRSDVNWTKILERCDRRILTDFETIVCSDLSGAKQSTATRMLAEYFRSKNDLESGFRLFKDVKASLLTIAMNAIVANPEEARKLLKIEMAKLHDELGPNSQFRSREGAEWCGRLGLLGLFLGDQETLFTVVGFNADPSAAISFISQFQTARFSPELVIPLLENTTDDWSATAFTSCIAGSDFGLLSKTAVQDIESRLMSLYRTHPSAGVHNALHTFLSQRGFHETVNELDATLEFREIRSDRNWFVNSVGMTMTIIRTPRRFWHGNLPNSINESSIKKEYEGEWTSSSIGWTLIRDEFAIATQAIKQPVYKLTDKSGDESHPVLNFDTGTSYCDWLSDQESLTGTVRYRLPTREEWDCVMRACHVKAVLVHNDERELKAIFHPFGIRLQASDPLMELTSSRASIQKSGEARFYVVKPGVFKSSSELFTSNIASHLPNSGSFCLRYCRNLSPSTQKGNEDN